MPHRSLLATRRGTLTGRASHGPSLLRSHGTIQTEDRRTAPVTCGSPPTPPPGLLQAHARKPIRNVPALANRGVVRPTPIPTATKPPVRSPKADRHRSIPAANSSQMSNWYCGRMIRRHHPGSRAGVKASTGCPEHVRGPTARQASSPVQSTSGIRTCSLVEAALDVGWRLGNVPLGPSRPTHLRDGDHAGLLPALQAGLLISRWPP
jgi:hypothetical protein